MEHLLCVPAHARCFAHLPQVRKPTQGLDDLAEVRELTVPVWLNSKAKPHLRDDTVRLRSVRLLSPHPSRMCFNQPISATRCLLRASGTCETSREKHPCIQACFCFSY